jgi:uncharacterized protein
MTEWEFLTELTRRSGCWLLLDISNVYVSAFNHGYDPHRFLTGIPVDRVVQFHLAGYTENGGHLLDTHDKLVSGPVWDLFKGAFERFGPVSTMIERDENIPELAEVLEEVAKARAIAEDVRCRSDRAQGQKPQAFGLILD